MTSDGPIDVSNTINIHLRIEGFGKKIATHWTVKEAGAFKRHIGCLQGH